MTIFREIVADLFSTKAFPALCQGMIIAILSIVLETSFASMIFSGPLAEYATLGAGLTLFGSVVLTLSAGLFSSFKSTVNIPQDSPVAVLSGISVVVAGAMASATSQAQFATVIAVMGFSAVATAVVFFMVGKFRLSYLVRFLPYPVVGGFLAGSGVLLCGGGIEVMCGVPISVETLGELFAWPALQFWLPGVCFIVLVYGAIKIRPHFGIMPGAVLLGLGVFYGAMFWLGADVEQARTNGWLLASLPGDRLWPVFGPADLVLVDWGVVLSETPRVLTMALLALVGLLLNVGGIELGVRQDLDMTRELMTGAVGNLSAGLGGSYCGFPALSLSMFGPRTGVNSRLIPLTVAICCGLVLGFGAEVLTYFPKALLGGFVFLVGFFFLEEWVFTGWKRLTPADYGVVLVILAAIAWIGFLQGVFLGLLLSIFIFLFRFSRVSVVAEETDGVSASSSRARSVPERAMLRLRGARIVVLRLDGYVFFGSACALSDRVGVHLSLEHPPSYVIIDFAHIDGFDISAVNNFQRLAQRAHSKDVMLVLAAVPDALFLLLERNASAESMAHVRKVNSLDVALAWCEDKVLARERRRLEHGEDGSARRDALFDEAADDVARHLEEMEQVEELVERLGERAVRRDLADGEIVLRQGDTPGGLFLVLWGGLALSVDNQRLGVEEQGGVVAAAAGFEEIKIPYDVRAEGRTSVVFVSREAVAALERDDTPSMLALYRLLVRVLGANK